MRCNQRVYIGSSGAHPARGYNYKEKVARARTCTRPEVALGSKARQHHGSVTITMLLASRPCRDEGSGRHTRAVAPVRGAASGLESETDSRICFKFGGRDLAARGCTEMMSAHPDTSTHPSPQGVSGITRGNPLHH
ncbi:hypothetical protein NDU88_008384 [Pleurodeles waltl]|uniref:Uncharacterized protein n=1 Tax=Pleurodeles waltl TaxID=8319 RepID=A0AAV7QND9_PLEWA|nr:hypothetical protein NDU88_008384 [Pleurodeles waltl]